MMLKIKKNASAGIWLSLSDALQTGYAILKKGIDMLTCLHTCESILLKHIPVSPFHEMKCKLCEQIKHFLTEKILAYSVVCVNRFFVKIKIFA